MYVGKIIATTTPKANTDTSGTTFTLEKGKAYSIQPDAECFITSDVDAASVEAALTAGKGYHIEANALFDHHLPPGHQVIGVMAVAGTVNAPVFRDYRK
jgi:hypothetical protein